MRFLKRQLAAFELDPKDLESKYVLSQERVALPLIAGAVLLLVAVNATILVTLSGHNARLGTYEANAALFAFAVQSGSILQSLARRRNAHTIWVSRVIMAIKLLAAATNLWLYTFPSPFVVDAITGRPNSMLRLGEWSVLAGVMGFLIDATNATELRQPVLTGLTQGLSTTCGLLLPLIESKILWICVLVISFMLFGYLFWRLYRQEVNLREMERTQPASSYDLAKARLATRLLRLCICFWSVLVAVWVVEAAGRFTQSGVEWGFVANCIVDAASKYFYMSLIDEASEAEPELFEKQRGRIAGEWMHAVWTRAKDVLIISQSGVGGTLATAATPSLADLIGEESAAKWISGRVHRLTDETACVLAEGDRLILAVDDLFLEKVIHAAWRHPRFTCVIGSGADALTCDVRSTTSETADSCVIVIRDVTDRDRIFKMECDMQVSSIERLKDEDANRFSRHEIKNSVLATLSQITALKSVVWAGVDPVQIHQMLGNVQSGLHQTLETVLSTAMARDVLHGNYVLRAAPCQIEEVLGAGLCATDAKLKSRFPFITRPASLPIVDVDARLLSLVHRNAVLNACKYGLANGVITTEIELEDHVLTIRVINEPGAGHAGPGHAELLHQLDAAERVFAKGTRLLAAPDEEGDTMARVSKGDGGWIMKKCADSMQGECSIRFETARTIFELTCPAPERLDIEHLNSVDLSDRVWAIGIDDCEFQRLVLSCLFTALGVPDHRITILGATDDEMRAACDRIVAACNALPPDGFLLVIVDENLDLIWPSHETVSGSSAIKRALSQLAPDVEMRVFALVRSGQDSHKDLELYLERAHGYLPKSASGQPDRDTVLDKWVRRFGFKSVTPKVPKVAPDDVVGGGEDSKEFLMARELGRLTRLLDKSISTMRWGELFKWLHRIKGVLQSTRVMGAREEADAITAIIDMLRPMQETPEDIGTIWMDMKQRMQIFCCRVLGSELGVGHED